MQVYCKKTDGHAEVRCCVCGQGFLLLWERQTSIERAVIKAEFQEMLRRQHRAAMGQEAHPMREFAVPEWKGSAFELITPVEGETPTWDL